MRRGRPIPELILNSEEQETLQRWARRPTSAQALALRARVILACATGKTNSQVSAEMQLSKPAVGKWRSRFVARRLDGLLDEPRPGAPRKISDAEVERVLTWTLEKRPPDATHWSTRSMAERSGLSQSAVSRIWRAFALQPHRTKPSSSRKIHCSLKKCEISWVCTWLQSATVSREADRWFIAMAVEIPEREVQPPSGEAVGIDLGLTTFAVLSNGPKVEAPKPLGKGLLKLRRLSRAHSRKQRGSHHRQKVALRLARCHRRMANIRRDFLHKFTTRISKNNAEILVEDLNRERHGAEPPSRPGHPRCGLVGDAAATGV